MTEIKKVLFVSEEVVKNKVSWLCPHCGEEDFSYDTFMEGEEMWCGYCEGEFEVTWKE